MSIEIIGVERVACRCFCRVRHGRKAVCTGEAQTVVKTIPMCRPCAGARKGLTS